MGIQEVSAWSVSVQCYGSQEVSLVALTTLACVGR